MDSHISIFNLEDKRVVSVEVFESKTLQGRFLSGDSPLQMVEHITEYTGRMQPLPSWVFDGAVVGIESGSEHVEEGVNKLIEADVPITAVWIQDWAGNKSDYDGTRI